MRSLEVKRRLLLAATFGFLLAFASMSYAQELKAILAGQPPDQSPTGRQAAPFFLNLPALESNGSLGEFIPRTDVTLDSADPFWNGKPVQVEKEADGNEVVGGIFNFTRILIPAGVTVRFKGYKYVVLAASQGVKIDGSVDLSGENGTAGAIGEDGPPGGGAGDGGPGGAGGVGDPGMGNGGVGGGGGGSFLRQGVDGSDGAGPSSPGRPGTSCNQDCNLYGGCGSAGGGNGTNGAGGSGPGSAPGGQAFGNPVIPDGTSPGGGGGGSTGGCGWRCTDGTIVDCGGGGGGGSGGAGGTLIIRSQDSIMLGGIIKANGGNGGNGSNGGVMRCPPSFPVWGCNGGGGGGGGAGGLILLESSESITISGSLLAGGGLGGLRGLGPAPHNRHGFEGGAGGGGRIAAFAPQITGITPSNGSAASGRTTVGQPTVFIASVEVLSADVTEDRIQVRLSPSTMSGNLRLELTGPNTHLIRQVTRSGGTYNETFDIPNLAEGEYTKVRAQWTISGRTITGTFDYHIRALGRYRHSQYNIPYEGQCADPNVPAYITNPACNFDPTTLRNQFVSQVNLNGSGNAIDYGFVRREVFCLSQPGAPPDASGRSFRAVASIDGACDIGLSNLTVARRPGHPYLGCGDTVFIHTVGLKTVTDLCPGCPNNQLDNFTFDDRCAGITDLGNFMTIKIF
ncbi:MAG: hypothetical protein HYR55_07725 [Acidobacteria bacterium]|nr:hypothetical protein [Acidobacteriota bacterium]